MPSQVLTSVENNFTKGLITESTGLNFPENAATDTDNCEYTLVGNVKRRLGINYENGYITNPVSTSVGINSYKWNNAGGDGSTQIIVVQNGATLNFYRSSTATSVSPVSTQILASTVVMTNYTSSGGSFDTSLECQFSDGNGYLFVFHPNCDPIYCSYSAGVISANIITVQIRDFTGVVDTGLTGSGVNTRPTSLPQEHLYNISNQGWTAGNPWQVTTNNANAGIGSFNFVVAAGQPINLGDTVTAFGTGSGGAGGYFSGTVTGYVGAVLTVNITSTSFGGVLTLVWTITAVNQGLITTWHAAEGNYPSNADVWWYFKNTSGVFSPATTQPNVSLSSGNAPQGHFLLNAFQQQRSATSGISGLTDVTTTSRPSNGCWFQGRVWYTGVTASQQATGDAAFYTWSENIYFSQVNVGTATNFGNCFQENDPTSENLNGLLPTDGGIIQIQGSGQIYKLFPIQNGMLVFAANGVWFITGSTGIGFSASDYTITKLSNVESISGTSFVDVLGLPYFWNEEGVYAVTPQQSGGLAVNSITVGTIQTFYDDIPKQSKKYVRGVYSPIDYVIKWVYRDVIETGISDRYSFDTILNYNVYNKAFYPYSVSNTGSHIQGIKWVQSPGGTTDSNTAFKFIASLSGNQTFAEERDTTYVDWAATSSVNFSSYFITGYKLHGQAQRRFQMPYIYMFNRIDEYASIAYNIQGLWDYASDRNSNRWSVPQFTMITRTHFGNTFRRHRIRGQGLVLQIKLTSVDGQPFDIPGWSVFEQQNTGV